MSEKVVDCYGVDLGEIISLRQGRAVLRKLTNANRYRRRHDHNFAIVRTRNLTFKVSRK